MATMLAHLTIREGGEARFEELTRELYATSHAEEPQLVRYEYVRTATPRKYYCFLSFETEAAFLQHQASDHHEGAAAELRHLIVDGEFEWLDPVPGSSPLGRTEAGGPRSSANPVELAYHREMPVVMQDWWKPLREA